MTLSDPDPSDLGADWSQTASTLFEAEVRERSERPFRRPRATYRLQLHNEFRFTHVRELVDYLDRLGVSDVYLSPHLAARPGSRHGYDVFDHGRINPELGDEDDYAQLLGALAAHQMGRVLDIVPNHMGITGGNPYWDDLLEHGPQARSARYFDVDWNPAKEELHGRVLLPVLGDQYGRVLENGELALRREGGSFILTYYEHRWPITPRSYDLILDRPREELEQRLEDDARLEYQSILGAIRTLPPADETDPDEVARYRTEAEVLKRRIARLCEEQPEVARLIDENVERFRGKPGDPRSFDPLHQLLERQVYRLAYWRVAVEEINYRRFFDINDLAGLRTEDPEVFETIHRKIFEWVDAGGVTALRIDHPDGLADPAGYFERLQEALLIRACLRRLGRGLEEDERAPLEEAIRQRYQTARRADPSGPIARRFPIVIEKILSRGEELPEGWPIDGTVGYEYMNMLNGIFVDPEGAATIDESYVDLTGDRLPWAEVVHEAKQLICRASLASEVNMLARRLNRVSEHDRRSRDFTLNDLRRSVREVISCFQVYRTYWRPGEPLNERDRAYIEQAVHRARRRIPTIDSSVFAFIRDALLLEHPEGIAERDIEERESFVIRFQQTTGPVTAKGVEDTAFYRQYKLASLNEVGGEPARFGGSPQAFHGLNQHRLAHWSGDFSTTATHDHKRGEDTRMRINVLSELADEWRTHLNRWAYWNARKKTEVHGALAPDEREEYLFYQTLIGVWPFGGPEEAAPEGLIERVDAYLHKAIREAKVNLSWTDADPSYAESISSFVSDVLAGEGADVFLKDFLPFQRRVARIAVIGSLSQALIKATSPGVPDLYQGCELWDFSLVDPDNRRPVDYALRVALLDRIQAELDRGRSRAELAAELLAHPEDGAIKLYLLWTALNHRKAHASLYECGAYRALEADGDRRGNLVAFARHREGRSVLTIAPRIVAGAMGGEGANSPVGSEVWATTRLGLPDADGPRRWRNLLTDEVVEITVEQDRPGLAVAEVFRTIPFGLLVEA